MIYSSCRRLSPALNKFLERSLGYRGRAHEFIDVSIRLAANNCQWIEKGEIQFAVLPAHCAPNVPRQHLMVVQSSDVADEIARNEPKSVHVEDAEGTGISPSITTERPGIARDHELIPGDVCCIESDPEEFALAIVDL